MVANLHSGLTETNNVNPPEAQEEPTNIDSVSAGGQAFDNLTGSRK